jgi:hypothetical protein
MEDDLLKKRFRNRAISTAEHAVATDLMVSHVSSDAITHCELNNQRWSRFKERWNSYSRAL